MTIVKRQRVIFYEAGPLDKLRVKDIWEYDKLTRRDYEKIQAYLLKDENHSVGITTITYGRL